MHIRFSITVFALAALSLSGCSLPRGPINIDPLVPRWISQGEVGCECPAEPAMPLHGEAGATIDPALVQPPISKFHPVPTRPVFEPPTPRLIQADTGGL